MKKTKLNSHKLLISLTCISIIVSCCLGTVIASGDYTPSSKGIIQINNDVIFDASDLDTIYGEVLNGKTQIASAIKDADLELDGNKGDAIDLDHVYTFTELVTGVDPWDDIQSGLGYYTKDSDGNFIKNSTKRTNLYDSVDSIDALDRAIAEDNISYASSIEGQNALSSLGFIHIPEGKMLRIFTGYAAGDNTNPAIELIDIPRTGSGINIGYSVNILRTEDVYRIITTADGIQCYYMNIVDGSPIVEAQYIVSGTIINHTRTYFVVLSSAAPQYAAAVRFE